jgi:hypothetical protein
MILWCNCDMFIAVIPRVCMLARVCPCVSLFKSDLSTSCGYVKPIRIYTRHYVLHIVFFTVTSAVDITHIHVRI